MNFLSRYKMIFCFFLGVTGSSSLSMAFAPDIIHYKCAERTSNLNDVANALITMKENGTFLNVQIIKYGTSKIFSTQVIPSESKDYTFFRGKDAVLKIAIRKGEYRQGVLILKNDFPRLMLCLKLTEGRYIRE